MQIQFVPGYDVMVAINGTKCGVIAATPERVSAGSFRIDGIVKQMFDLYMEVQTDPIEIKSFKQIDQPFKSDSKEKWKGSITETTCHYNNVLELYSLKHY